MCRKVLAAFFAWLAICLSGYAQFQAQNPPAQNPSAAPVVSEYSTLPVPPPPAQNRSAPPIQSPYSTLPLPPPQIPWPGQPNGTTEVIPDVERPEVSLGPESAWVSQPDCHCFWVSAEYLLWWVKSAPTPQPILTSGSSSDPIPGALGQRHTNVLFGQRDISFMPTSGARLGIGDWLDRDHLWAIEVNAFLLAHADRRAAFASDGNSDLMYARPIINPATGESAFPVSLNNQVAGTVFASTSTQLVGWDLNGIRNIMRSDRLEWNILAGFREVYLRETLTVQSDSLALQPRALNFAGQSLQGGDQILVNDHYRAATVFYGPQFGSKFSWWTSRFGVDIVGKLALGVAHESVSVYGDTTYLPANSIAGITVPGGLLALSSNIGRYSRERFAAIPEIDLNMHYDLATWARLDLGYSLIYLSSAVRPGLVVDRTVDPSRVPSNANYGSITTSSSPTFLFNDSGYWAQGLNLGITFRY